MLHILQITDCHLFPSAGKTLLGVATQASLDAVLHGACAERTPDAVLATGDIAQRPAPATYALFLSTLRRHFEGPLLCVPGNHDHGATFAASLPTDDVVVGGWRLVGVDTHIDDVVSGSVGAAELERLAALPTGPTVVAGHHCPAHTGCAWLDEHRIDNGDAVLAALDASAVAAYVFGHIHQPFEGRGGNGSTPLFGTPSTCFQFAQDTASFALDDAKPGYRWLRLADDGTVATELRRVDFDINLDLKDRDR